MCGNKNERYELGIIVSCYENKGNQDCKCSRTPSLLFLIASQQTFPSHERTWACTKHNKIYRKSAGHSINCRSSKLFQYIKAPPRQARAAEGPMWTSVLSIPYLEAHTNKLLFSPNYRLLSHKNSSKKSTWGSLHRNPVEGSKNSLRFQVLHIFPSVPLSLHVLLRSN